MSVTVREKLLSLLNHDYVMYYCRLPLSDPEYSNLDNDEIQRQMLKLTYPVCEGVLIATDMLIRIS